MHDFCHHTEMSNHAIGGNGRFAPSISWSNNSLTASICRSLFGNVFLKCCRLRGVLERRPPVRIVASSFGDRFGVSSFNCKVLRWMRREMRGDAL